MALSLILAAALMFVLTSAAASLILLLPVIVAAESLHNLPLRAARRFWIVATTLPVLVGVVATAAGFGFLSGGIAANPHEAELRTRTHVCLARLTMMPDAAFRFRLYALLALGLLLFALARLVWGLYSSWRAQALADRLRELVEPVAGSQALLADSEEADCFSIGLSRPVVVLTEGLSRALTEEELAAVLAHEQCHVRHADLPAELVLRALSDPLIWVPSTHYYLHMARAAMEQRCDEQAAEQTSRPALLSALEKMARAKQARQVRLQGDLAPLRPTFPGYANPAARMDALTRQRYVSVALPLPVIIGLEIVLLLATAGWLRHPIHDTLYCAVDSLRRVLRL